MNKLIISFILLIGIGSNVFAGTYGGGSGVEGDPYLISDANDMQEIGANSADWGSHFLMTNDIDLGRFTGTEFNIIGNKPNAFTGVFDGGGNSILNFKYETSVSDSFIGIFGYIDDINSGIKNLTVIDPNIIAEHSSVGVIIGKLYNGTIDGCIVKGGSVSGGSVIGGLVGCGGGSILNCYTSVDVIANPNSTQIGGLIGDGSGPITNCHAEGQVYGAYNTGGLVGIYTGDNKILYCSATGNVSGNNFIGGLVGDNSVNGGISNSFALGNVNGNSRVGGLVGLNYSSSIMNCYATGSVIGNEKVGGLVGDNWSGIFLSYARGSVTGNVGVGGFVGDNINGSYSHCFWDHDINPTLEDIGNFGEHSSIVSKSTADMKKQSTFTIWDFTETWSIEDNQTYPFLKLSYPVGDLNYDHIVNILDFSIMSLHWLEDNNM